MYLPFKEEFDLPISMIFPYFESPSEWGKLYGIVEPSKILKNNWHAIPLKKFPFPLIAKNVEYHHEKSVRWIFGGFWRGVGEVNFYSKDNKTIVEGFEYITPHGLWLISSLFEKHFMEKEFERIWNLGWNRIRKNKVSPHAGLDLYKVGLDLQSNPPKDYGLYGDAERGRTQA